MKEEFNIIFSVVIPLYNKAHTIGRTLKTVLNQTHHLFEVIIVDDGSTDNGISVINELTEDSRVKIIKQHNQGVSVARNVGVGHSNNEFIAFLDGDDEWLPTYLEKMAIVIRSFPEAGMFCCAGMGRDKEGNITYRIASKYKGQIKRIDFFENPHVFLHTSATVVSKKEFNKIGGFPIGMKINEDFALFFSLALLTPVAYCGYSLAIYVGGVEGQATSIDIKGDLTKSVDRFNLVHSNWLQTPKVSSNYVVFLKYELRHTFLICLKSMDYESLNILYCSLSPKIMDLFPLYELSLYKAMTLNKFAILNIKLTKLRWRLRGFPYVGQK